MGESGKSRPPQVCSRTEVSIYLPAPIPLPLEATPPLPYLTLSWVQAPFPFQTLTLAHFCGWNNAHDSCWIPQ